MSVFRSFLLKSHRPTSINKTFTSPTYQNKKPLRLVFEEAVGLCERQETDIESLNNEVKRKLLALETEVRDLKAEEEPKNDKGIQNAKKIEREIPKSLYAVFTGKEVEMKKRKELEGPKVFKELSPDMKLFTAHLYEQRYFRDANFFRSGHLDFSCFDDSYGRDFIKFAAENFAKDHQEIAKWLSGSDLKKVALFGCPSLSRKNVFSAKRLRNFFEIRENTVCGKCVLKHSCKFVNQSVWKTDRKTLNLAIVLRVIISYALEEVEPELTVPDEINTSISRLLKEVLKLSQAIS